MFTNEENLFLEAISKMFSNSNEERRASEKNIQTWLQETYLQVLISCNKFIVCEELPSHIREYSCYLLQVCTGSAHYEDWQKINSELKASVQTNSLSLLGDKNAGIRTHACILVTSIYSISVRDQGWNDLIRILCSACDNDNIDFKISAIKTLGMIWEKLSKEPFSLNEMQMMENTIINLLGKPYNEELAIICLEAYQYFMLYIKEKFTDVNYLENSLKLLINYCNAKNNINTTDVIKSSIHCISQMILLAYDYVEKHFRNISEFFIQLAEGQDEFLAWQALIFFIEVCQDEINRRDNGYSYRKYISSIWDILWNCIQFILNMGKKDTQEEFCRYDMVNYLLVNLSILCDESIIDDIFSYMGAILQSNNNENNNENNHLMKINSAIYAFGSLMETIHVKKIESVIPDSINLMTNLFTKNNEKLSKTLSWCFSVICSNHQRFILESNNLFQFLITTILQLLKEQSLSNPIKMHLCQTIYALASYIYDHNIQSYNLFSPYLQDLLITLEALAYFPNSYIRDNNLTEKCFIAMASLIECSHEKDKLLISYFMEKILIRLKEAQDISKFNGNKDKQHFYQSLLSLCVQSLSKNSVFNLIQLSNEKIGEYFDIIESYFKMRGSVFEEGFLALSGLITLISDNQEAQYVQRLMVYIFFALNNYTDYNNCSNACLSLLDIIRASKEKFVPYIKDLIAAFNNIIKAEDVKKNIFSLIIVVYSDLFNYIDEQIWIYCEEPFNFMNQIIEYTKNNKDSFLRNKKIDQDELDYFIKLNEGLVDFIESVAAHLKISDENKQEVFKNYMPDIIEYLSTMMEDQMFNPSNDFLNSCLCFLSDFGEIYKKYLFKRINDYTLQRIFQFANNSDNDNIIHLKDILQNLIYTIKMQN